MQLLVIDVKPRMLRILKMAGYENATSDKSRYLPMNSSIGREYEEVGLAIRGYENSNV